MLCARNRLKTLCTINRARPKGTLSLCLGAQRTLHFLCFHTLGQKRTFNIIQKQLLMEPLFIPGVILLIFSVQRGEQEWNDDHQNQADDTE